MHFEGVLSEINDCNELTAAPQTYSDFWLRLPLMCLWFHKNLMSAYG